MADGREPGPPLNTITFGEWTPDVSRLGAGLRTAKGVLASGGRYVPIEGPAVYNATAQTAGDCIGAGQFYTNSSGSHLQIFLGDRTTLYKLVDKTAVNWSRSVGGAYAIDPDWVWHFEQFGEYIFAGGRGARLQHYAFGKTQARFEDVTGDDAPRSCDAVMRVRAHMLVASGRSLKWSAFNDPLSWTPDLATQAGETELSAAGGQIMAGIGGETGSIFQERGIVRFAYVGPPSTWMLDEVEIGRGLIGPKAVVALGRTMFYVAQDGFFLFDGLQSQPIGNGRVDKYFTSRLNYAYRHRVSCALDTARKAILVVFPAASSAMPNEALIWSYADNRWTHDAFDCQLAFNLGREGVSADNTQSFIDLFGTAVADSITASVDSPLFRESRAGWATIDSSRRVNTFTGPSRAATIETGEVEITPGRKGWLTELWPLTDAPAKSLTLDVAGRLSQMAISQALTGKSRRNEILWSEDLTQAASWVPLAVLPALSGIAPDGTASASKLAETAVTSNHYVTQTVGLPSNTQVIVEARVKAVERSRPRLVLFDSVVPANFIRASCDLVAETVAADGGGVGIVHDYGMRKRADGWWDVWLAGIASDQANALSVRIGLADNAGATNYLGVANAGLLVWGVHLQPGRFRAPYLMTQGAAMTRAGTGIGDTGYCPVAIEARFLQPRLSIEAGAVWTEASGVHHNGVTAGVA